MSERPAIVMTERESLPKTAYGVRAGVKGIQPKMGAAS
jgi:hypothetical protein